MFKFIEGLLTNLLDFLTSEKGGAVLVAAGIFLLILASGARAEEKAFDKAFDAEEWSFTAKAIEDPGPNFSVTIYMAKDEIYLCIDDIHDLTRAELNKIAVLVALGTAFDETLVIKIWDPPPGVIILGERSWLEFKEKYKCPVKKDE